ncbi:hypothetical protein FAF44_24930 [Nonomuraea sp. MG754425]|uniref:VOC family protein n=1 Tax=Nonomuraea sp. MG754425 TaxID=2570319 RepID=UPI001F34B132|nr:hypothetical protein [Nonomuraea sp. MG754425]MCF6471614.1 hypothetical protein [Nonomuraea sp. MG754425]
MDNTVAWFEVATADPEGAERFYGGLFGRTFAAADGQAGYRVINRPGVDFAYLRDPSDSVFGIFHSRG